MHQLNTAEVRRLREIISLMLEEHRNGTNENGQNLTCRRQRHSNSNTGGDVLVTLNHNNSGDGGCQSRVGSHRRTDVHPAQCDELQCATEHNAGSRVTQRKTHQGTSDQGAVELTLVHHGCDARNERHENNENKRQGAHASRPFCLRIFSKSTGEWLGSCCTVSFTPRLMSSR